MNVPFESQFDPQESVAIGTSLDSVDTGARASVVNRTHRVVRQRAKLMQARRNQVRGLMVPLILCSILLILTAVAVWSGLYQNQAAEAAEVVQADVAALADANDHFLVMLLWFVPVSVVLLGTLLIRRTRNTGSHETVR
jgi:hypothetical protein